MVCDLSSQLKGHPAIVGYNPLNEPHPEKLNNLSDEKISNILHNFYQEVINAIRSTDAETPIILDSSNYGDAKAFKLLKPQDDDKVLYSLHMYEPYAYTNLKTNQGKFKYPGMIKGLLWNKEVLKDYMQAVVDFQKNIMYQVHEY